MGTLEGIQYIVQQIVARLIESYQPQRVILYGSLAYGEPNEDSDIDLLIIKETAAPPWSVGCTCVGWSPIQNAAFPSHRWCLPLTN